MRTIVVSAVNLRKGGTLAILRQCLEYLSRVVAQFPGEYRVVALVHKRGLCEFPGIEYVEMPWCIKSWGHRLWAEYVSMHRISLELAEQDGYKVWLWLSLHDTTPRVEAEHRMVYCHTSYPFLKLRLRDWWMDPKIPLFALFTKWAYRINIRRNDYVIVQQDWFAGALASLTGVPAAKFRVVPPLPGAFRNVFDGFAGCPSLAPELSVPESVTLGARPENRIYTFLFASTPDCHKNFETLCEAASRLEAEGAQFKLILTLSGSENRYSKWLFKHWGGVESIDFHGLMPKNELYKAYSEADCLVFPSRIETWGLPISEYLQHHPGGSLILSDLPYAHETAGDADARYFDPDDAESLKRLMYENIAAR